MPNSMMSGWLVEMRMMMNSERGETKLAVIAIAMGIAVLVSISSIVSSCMNEEMIRRADEGDEFLRKMSGRHRRQVHDTERPLRGQTLTF